MIVALLIASFVLALGTPAAAQTGANVAVVINENSPASVQIGEYYAQKRQVPGDNIIRLKTEPEETISRAAYSSDIETPIAKALTAHALQDRILYIVLTKGVPLLRVPVIERSPMYANYGPGALLDRETVLFDLQNDPEQLRPVNDAEVEGRLSGLMAELMAATEAPDEAFTRIGFEPPVKASASG